MHIIDEQAQKKMVCVDPNDIPCVAIVDPELMYSMPKGLTAATGMDALTHAIESYITPGAWLMSDMFELKAIEMIAGNLKAAVDNGNDPVAREAMSQAQYIAGMGFSNVGLGIVHSMAHPLGAHYDTPHGVANALLLPYVMEYNAESPAAPKYIHIAKAMGVDTEGMTEAEGVKAAIEAVRALSLSINIPQKLHEIGVREEDLHQLAIDAFNDVCTGGNPRPTSIEDIEALYRKAPNSPYPVRNHPTGYFFNAQKGRVLREYQLLYITKGQGSFASDDTPDRQVGKGHLIVLFPGQWHTYKPDTATGWNEYYIGFEGTMADQLVRNSFLTKDNQVLDIGLNEELAMLFSRALEVAEEDKTASQQYLAGIVLHMIGLVLSVSRNNVFEKDNVSEKMEQAKIIMNENLCREIDPEQLAARLNLSYSWFRKAFKDYTGYAPAKYFQELKMRKAKQLLVGSTHSVKEICFMLGYTSTEHFSNLFKKHAGITPLKYRAFGRDLK